MPINVSTTYRLHFKIFMNNFHNFYKYENSQNIYMLHLRKGIVKYTGALLKKK